MTSFAVDGWSLEEQLAGTRVEESMSWALGWVVESLRETGLEVTLLLPRCKIGASLCHSVRGRVTPMPDGRDEYRRCCVWLCARLGLKLYTADGSKMLEASETLRPPLHPDIVIRMLSPFAVCKSDQTDASVLIPPAHSTASSSPLSPTTSQTPEVPVTANPPMPLTNPQSCSELSTSSQHPLEANPRVVLGTLGENEWSIDPSLLLTGTCKGFVKVDLSQLDERTGSEEEEEEEEEEGPEDEEDKENSAEKGNGPEFEEPGWLDLENIPETRLSEARPGMDHRERDEQRSVDADGWEQSLSPGFLEVVQKRKKSRSEKRRNREVSPRRARLSQEAFRSLPYTCPPSRFGDRPRVRASARGTSAAISRPVVSWSAGISDESLLAISRMMG